MSGYEPTRCESTPTIRPSRRAGPIIPWVPAVAAGALLVWAVYDQGAFLAPSKTIVALAMPALGLLHGSLRTWRRRSPLRWTLLDWLFLALALFGALSAIWSIDPVSSLRAAAVLLGGLFFVRLGRDVGSSSSKARDWLLGALGLMGTLVSILAIAGYAAPLSEFSLIHDGARLAVGTLGYANALAAFLLLTLAAGWAVLCGARLTTTRLLLAGVCTALHLVALGLSRSRAAAAVLVLLLVLVVSIRLFARGNHKWRNRVLGILLAGLLVGGIAYAASLWLGQFRPWGPMTADVFRINTWKAALRAASDKPLLGYGLDTFYQAYAPYKQGALTTHAHNIFIQQLVETGAVGVALLAAFLASAVLAPVRLLAGRLRNPQIPLLLGTQAFVLLNLTDLAWYFPALLFVFSLSLGFLGTYKEPPHNKPQTEFGSTSVDPVAHSSSASG